MKRYLKYVIVLFALGVIYLFLNRDMLKYKPMQNVTVDNPSYLVDLTGGEKIVIDKSGKRFFYVNEKGEIQFIKTGGDTTEKSFYTANCIVTDSQNNIYLLDVVRIEGGRKISKERILKYSSDGTFEEVLLEIPHEDVTYKNKINKLFIRQDKLFYVCLESDSFVISDLDGNQVTYPYADADITLVDFAMNPRNGELVFVSKSGEVAKVVDAGSYSTIYEVASQKELLHIPWSITFDSEGKLYLSDIGTRTIYQLSESGELTPILHGYTNEIPEQFTIDEIKQCPVFYRIHAEDNLITTESYGVCVYENGEFIYESEYSLDKSLTVQSFIFWLILVIVAICTAILVVVEIRVILKSSTLVKTVAGLFGAMILVTALFSMIIIKSWTERMSAEVIDRASAAAKLTSELIPTDELQEIDSVEDFMSPSYQKVRDCLQNIYVSGEEWSEDLYYVVYRIQDGMITGAFSIEDYLGTIYPYDWPYEGSDEQYIMENQEAKVYTGLTTSEGNFIFVLHPIIDDKTGKSVGLLEVGTDLYLFQKENNRMIFELFLNAIVMSIVIILIAFEMMNYMSGRNVWRKWKLDHVTVMEKKENAEERRERRAVLDKAPVPVSVLRMIVFLIFFVTNMTRGFFPLYIIDLVKKGDGLFHLSTEMLIAIPMAAEVLFGAIFSMGGNVVIRLLGRRKAALFGSIVFVAGLSLRALFPSILMMIIGNSIMGCGWGILLLIVQVMIAEKEEHEKNEGFAGYTASSLSGMNSGVVFGAFLIGWISQQAVFGVVAILSILVLLLSICYIFDGNKEAVSEKEAEENPKNSMSTIAFLCRPKVSSYFLMIVIPVVVCGYFLSYLFPILGADLGISETNIGYSFLVNGIVVICFGKTLTVKCANRLGKKNSLAFSSLLYGIAFLLFAHYQNIPALMFTLVVLGISDSFGLPMQASYYTDLQEVKQYGYDRAMGVYSLFENMSQTAGSFIFGYVLLYGVQCGLNVLSVILILLAGLFLLINLLTKKDAKRHAKS